MYDRDMPIIRDHGLAGPDGFADVVTFALLTIRQHLIMVPPAFADVKEFGETSPHLLGAKRKGYAYLQAHKDVLHAAISKAAQVQDDVAAMDILLNIPSLGLVKAGFVCQMLGLNVGCLDQHNLEQYGLRYPRFHKAGIKTQATREKHIRQYVALTRRLGGARKLWDAWCAYIANPEARDAKFQTGIFASLRTASDVSRMHVIACGLAPAYDGAEVPF